MNPPRVPRGPPSPQETATEVLALLSLLIGAVIALVLRPTVSEEQSRYLAMAVVAALDSAFGGLRAHLEQTFSDRLFVLAFVSNAAVAVVLVWIGDQLGADLATAVAVVFGVRIFQNVAAVRRQVFGG
jgi:small basic protein